MEGIWVVSYLALWAIALLLVVLLLGLIREVGGLYSRVGPPGVLMTEVGLDVGKPVPSFTAVEIPTGGEVTFQPVNDRDAVVLFVSPNCEPCRKLLPALTKGWARWQRHVRVHVVCEGSEEEVRTLGEETKTKVPLLADPQARIRTGYGHPPTPFAYLIEGATGTVQLKGSSTSATTSTAWWSTSEPAHLGGVSCSGRDMTVRRAALVTVLRPAV